MEGQQRLTALYLLLNCLGLKVQNKLSFACREKSNFTLSNIKSIIEGVVTKRFKDEENKTEPGIINGLKIILEELGKPEFNKEQLLKNLERVVLYRIEVPENTDLNRYFEIMNTRGEQLEQHDILKAALMSYLPEESEKAIFAKIWDACSDMTGYVQMHFVSKNNTLREFLFGNG